MRDCNDVNLAAYNVPLVVIAFILKHVRVSTSACAEYIFTEHTRSVGSAGRTVQRRTVNRGDGGSIPPIAVSKLRQFRSPHICLCLSEESLKAGGPFYLVSMPGEVKDPPQGVNV